MSAAERTAATGLAVPGAGDVVGGAVDGLEQRRAGAGRVQVGRRREPDPPATAPARSVRMSPKRLSVTMTS